MFFEATPVSPRFWGLWADASPLGVDQFWFEEAPTTDHGTFGLPAGWS